LESIYDLPVNAFSLAREIDIRHSRYPRTLASSSMSRIRLRSVRLRDFYVTIRNFTLEEKTKDRYDAVVDLQVQIPLDSIRCYSFPTTRPKKYDRNSQKSHEKIYRELQSLKSPQDNDRVALDEYFDLLNSCISAAMNSISNQNVDALETNLSRLLGIKELRFVPFGRTILTEMLDYITEEPLSRAELTTTPLVSETHGGMLFSYLSWADKGRNMLRNSSEIQSMFVPVLQGMLHIEENKPNVIYENWDGSLTRLE
jgi:hypothetical protein